MEYGMLICGDCKSQGSLIGDIAHQCREFQKYDKLWKSTPENFEGLSFDELKEAQNIRNKFYHFALHLLEVSEILIHKELKDFLLQEGLQKYLKDINDNLMKNMKYHKDNCCGEEVHKA